MQIMNILTWLVFGTIVGFIANVIDPRPDQGGWIGSVILGIAGSLVGGFLGNLFFGVGVTGFNIPSFIVAILGSLLILVLGRGFMQAGRR